MSVNPIPAGFHTVAPNIIVKSVDAAVAFYKQSVLVPKKSCVSPCPMGKWCTVS
jgi:hypothetical protein